MASLSVQAKLLGRHVRRARNGAEHHDHQLLRWTDIDPLPEGAESLEISVLVRPPEAAVALEARARSGGSIGTLSLEIICEPGSDRPRRLFDPTFGHDALSVNDSIREHEEPNASVVSQRGARAASEDFHPVVGIKHEEPVLLAAQRNPQFLRAIGRDVHSRRPRKDRTEQERVCAVIVILRSRPGSARLNRSGFAGAVHGEVLEAVVTAKRDKAAALKFLKRIMKTHGRPRKIVTDGLCSYSAAMSATQTAKRPVVGSTIGRRILINRFADENGPCSGFEA